MIHCHPSKVYECFKLLDTNVAVAVFVTEHEHGTIVALYTADEFEKMCNCPVENYTDTEEGE